MVASGEALHSNQAEAALKPHLAAADRTSDCSEDPQDHADKHENATDRFQNINPGDITDYGENDTEDNHVLAPFYWASVELINDGLPRCRRPQSHHQTLVSFR